MTERLTTPASEHQDLKGVFRSSLISPSDTDRDFMSGSDDEDEVFFGPMSTVELRKMHAQGDIHRRSTQMLQSAPLPAKDEQEQSAVKIQAQWRGVMARRQVQNTSAAQCATPEQSPLPQNTQQEQAVAQVQRLARGALARREHEQRRDDMRLLAMKGTISVERRRRLVPRVVAPNMPLPNIPSRLPRPPSQQSQLPSQQSQLPSQKSQLPPPPARQSQLLTQSSQLPPQPSRLPRPPQSLPMVLPLPSMRPPPPPYSGLAESEAKNAVPMSPLRRGLSIRNWFQRQPSGTPLSEPTDGSSVPKNGSPSRSNTLKVTTNMSTQPHSHYHPHGHSVPQPNGGRARRYLGRLLATLRPKPLDTNVGCADRQRSEPVGNSSLLSGLLPQRSAQQDRRRLLQRRRMQQQQQRGRPNNTMPATRHVQHSSIQVYNNAYPPTNTPHFDSAHIPSIPDMTTLDTPVMMPTESHIPTHSILPVQEGMRKLRSPPFRANHVRTDSSSSASRPSPSTSAVSLERPATVGTKLSLLKTSIGSFLARPLSPRVTGDRVFGGSDECVSRELNAGPPPLPPKYDMDRSRGLESQSVFARMPLSAVGGSFAHSMASVDEDTDEDAGIAAAVSRIAPVSDAASVSSRMNSVSASDVSSVSSHMASVAAPDVASITSDGDAADDSESFTSISSLSASTMPSAGSMSDISMTSAGRGPSMSISPTDAYFSRRESSVADSKDAMDELPVNDSNNAMSELPIVDSKAAMEDVPVADSMDAMDVVDEMCVMDESPVALPSVTSDAKALSPRLSLRLSADGSVFGMGLSVFASLMDAVEGVDSAVPDMGKEPVAVEKHVVDEPVVDESTAADVVVSEESLSNDVSSLPQPTEPIETVESNETIEPIETAESNDTIEPIESTEPIESNEAAEPIESADPPEATESDKTAEPESPAEPEAAETVNTEAAEAAKTETAKSESADEDNPVLERLRSLRSRRQREREAQSKKPVALQTQEVRPDSARRFRATQTAGTRGARQGSTGLAAMGTLQLDRLTKLNTRRNSTYMTCTIDRVVVERTGERPPSPSLLMQERVHERRIMAELDGGEPYHSIYSGSSDESSGMSSDDSLSADEDRVLSVDTRPLSPLSADDAGHVLSDGADAADLPGIVSASSSSSLLSASDVHRSVELAAVPVARVGTTASGPSKKQCVQRTRRVHWGTKSTLQATWLVGRMPSRTTNSSRPILTRRETDDASSSVDVTPPTSSRGTKSRRQSRNLAVVTVSCFEYPDHMVDEPYDEDCIDPDELSMEEYEPADDEFVPRRSSRKAK
ncbi:hypothetical protein IW147_002708 [Coemansia sp. RSA 720]|nr:hypothetical protein IW147_002708 [Coemansia sp. RSA 720]